MRTLPPPTVGGLTEAIEALVQAEVERRVAPEPPCLAARDFRAWRN